jgi:hypothetical protein
MQESTHKAGGYGSRRFSSGLFKSVEQRRNFETLLRFEGLRASEWFREAVGAYLKANSKVAARPKRKARTVRKLSSA